MDAITWMLWVLWDIYLFQHGRLGKTNGTSATSEVVLGLHHGMASRSSSKKWRPYRYKSLPVVTGGFPWRKKTRGGAVVVDGRKDANI